MRRLACALLVLAALWVCGAWADQPPPDAVANTPFCTAAKTQGEIDQCAAAAYGAADKELNAAYQAVLKRWSNYPAVQDTLRRSQRDWLVYRDADLKARFAFEDTEAGTRGTMYPAAYAFYEASLTRERTARLCDYLRGTAYGEVDPAPCADLIKQPRIVSAPHH